MEVNEPKKDAFLELTEKLIGEEFIYEKNTYKCIDCKMIRGINLAIYTKNRTIVLFFRDEISKITYPIIETLEIKKPKTVLKYGVGLKIEKESISNLNLDLNTIKGQYKIPISDELRTFLTEKYKNLPTSLEERAWSEEEDNFLFRTSTRVLANIFNRPISIINRMKMSYIKNVTKGRPRKNLSQVNTKPLNAVQIKHFTKKYSELPSTLKERVWSLEESELLFRGTTNDIATILNRPLNVIYKKKKEEETLSLSIS